MSANPLLGVFLHWLGGLASASFYVPFRRVRGWSWETYWLVGGVASWIVAPWLIAGLLTFIPYVGSVIGGMLSIGLALFQFWGSPEWILAVAVIFVIGQTIEGNFLTPKLVGGSVGLHPVWLMFALSAFGSLFGFTGMLIAVPVAACIGVFSRFGVRQYLSGRLYIGHTGKITPEVEEAIAEAKAEAPDLEDETGEAENGKDG